MQKAGKRGTTVVDSHQTRNLASFSLAPLPSVGIDGRLVRTTASFVRTDGSFVGIPERFIRMAERFVRTDEWLVRALGTAVRTAELFIRTAELFIRALPKKSDVDDVVTSPNDGWEW